MDSAAPYDYKQAAARLGVTQRWLERQVQSRSIPYHRLGHYVRFTDDDLAAIMRAAQVAPVPTARRRKPKKAS
jgi:excisionase family DNA binding protein